MFVHCPKCYKKTLPFKCMSRIQHAITGVQMQEVCQIRTCQNCGQRQVAYFKNGGSVYHRDNLEQNKQNITECKPIQHIFATTDVEKTFSPIAVIQHTYKPIEIECPS